MKNFFLEKQLQRIEKEVSDDLRMIMEAGPQYFSNHELYGLLDQLNNQEEQVLLLNRKLFFILSTISLWAAAFFLSNAIGMYWLGQFSLACIPLVLITFISGNIYLRRKFRTYRHSEIIRSVIYQELERRRKDASIS